MEIQVYPIELSHESGFNANTDVAGAPIAARIICKHKPDPRKMAG